ncbi:hypothetical protein OAA35_00585 [bacterium]|nr:hypothetical protein [bacterium]
MKPFEEKSSDKVAIDVEPERKIQGEKPETGNVVSVQRGYIGKKRSGISISAMQNQKKQEQEAEVVEDLSNKPKTVFTSNELMSKWNAFAYQLKDRGRQGLYITLTKRKPEIKQNFLLEFTIDNEIQNIELEDERSNLLTFLRVELNNYGIQLKVLLSTEDNSVKHLSSKDKFLKMAEKNPALHELRERLNLDIEY